MKQYAIRDIMALDKVGEYYSRHVLAMTQEQLHEKCDIAAELAWRDHQIDRLEFNLGEALSWRENDKAKIERLRNAAKAVLQTLDALYRNHGFVGEVTDWETLRKVVSET